ncbi:carboxypeptidase-like regulatory domain-containing protein [Parabacteroides sp. 52]|uniref:DUF5686 and carboxypeptidase regulatory-like domain-containing protein n=1 Tax=unclassified Parabacteroides TaxID=2649774 RepID=UPI0013D18A90|nr:MULTISPECIES: DUF5686 and carboxypeptidase regulatory-like domain-containing protein [unclassified Parabacteroides]MDH6535005.1 hypothetical protein [Parabacteroides sp. PM5-20]NDV55265.1 carboxypeptidase-like regulatory domain-containing protein [Parabacteroides sp. 52]
MRTYYLFFLFLCMLVLSPLSAQNVKGKVVDSSGEPVFNASVYIREIAQGIMADDRGEFQTTLQAGNYTIECSSLGYERKSLSVAVGEEPVSLTIELQIKAYSIREVVVNAKREDPAYSIMRKAISMAPFYLHQIKRYESEIYLKGTLKVEKIPRLLKIQAGASQEEIKNIENKLFLIESQNEVIFTAPNTYDQRVVAATSNIPSDVDVADAMDVITTNIYDPNAMGRISPLSPQAFTYYKFTWEGAASDGTHLINKIRVQPKKKSPKLVTGWLYIIANSWNVQSADLSATEFGITIRFTATYNEVKPYAFLPTAYDMDLKVDIMGVKATGKYYSSIQYKEVEINEAQGVIRKKEEQVVPVLTEKPKSKKQQKAQQKLDILSQKENLNNRDAYKMAQLMKEVVEPEEQRKAHESLELLSNNSSVRITVDSLASKRDSSYWTNIRDLPLRPEEVESYKMKDSLKLANESGERSITISTGANSDGILGKITGGHTFSLGKGISLGYNGLIGAVPEYNFVDGVWLGQRLTLHKKIKKGSEIKISPSAYYVTGRQTVNWEINGDFTYAPLRNGNLTLSGGNTTADFSNEGDLRFINSLSSLFFGKNPIKFYQKKFIKVINKVDLANGLNLTLGFSHEDRNTLENNLSFHIFGKHPEANIPGNRDIYMPNNSTTKYAVHLEYTPRHYYSIERGRKVYMHSSFPTISASYVRGINKLGNYHCWDAGIHQNIPLNEFDNITYAVHGGFFSQNDPVAFPDYKHFRTNELFITGNALAYSFNLLDNYVYSTNKRWLNAHLNYTSAYLLLKHIPFLQSYMFNESLHLKTLWIPHKNHTEAGYSLGIEDVGRIGVFVGLERGKYDSVGFTVSIPILWGMGVK